MSRVCIFSQRAITSLWQHNTGGKFSQSYIIFVFLLKKKINKKETFCLIDVTVNIHMLSVSRIYDICVFRFMFLIFFFLILRTI